MEGRLKSAQSVSISSEGQATLEYLVVLSVGLFTVIMLTRGIYVALDRGILSFGGKLEKSLKTGRASPSVYSN